MHVGMELNNMKIIDGKPLMCVEMFHGITMMRPFVMCRTSRDTMEIVWLELLCQHEPTATELVQAVRRIILSPLSIFQTLEFWQNLPIISVETSNGVFVGREAKMQTAPWWEVYGSECPGGEFTIYRLQTPLGWFAGAHADSREAATRFLNGE